MRILDIMGKCEDKWNCFNGDFKRIYDYHKGNGHNIFYYDQSTEEREKFHLSKLFIKDYYHEIETFQA